MNNLNFVKPIINIHSSVGEKDCVKNTIGY